MRNSKLLLFVRSKYAFPSLTVPEEVAALRQSPHARIVAKDCLICPVGAEEGSEDLAELAFGSVEPPSWVDFAEVISLDGDIAAGPDILAPIEFLDDDSEEAEESSQARLSSLTWGELEKWSQVREDEQSDEDDGADDDDPEDDWGEDYEPTYVTIIPPSRVIERALEDRFSGRRPSFGRRCLVMCWHAGVGDDVADRAAGELRKRLARNNAVFWQGRGIVGICFHDHRSAEAIRAEVSEMIDQSVFADHMVFAVSNVVLADRSGISLLQQWARKDDEMQRTRRPARESGRYGRRA